ncbi:MAG: hypothetical protein ISS35_06735 [Kiritimatiellae bacterium]|nr:hypothetical protein [Kiritimatiellia bacterium]
MHKTTHEIPPDQRPDVEAMIAEIRSQIADKAEPTPDTADDEKNFYENLATLNQLCTVGSSGGGLRGLRDRIASRLLGGLLAQINAFHSHMVRVLNGMVRLLDGTDDESVSAVLSRAQLRHDLLEQISTRLAAYDKLHIEERLTRIEAQIAAQKGGDSK